MRSPFSPWSVLLLGVGFGMIFGANIFGYHMPSVQVGLYVLGIVLMLIGLVLSIYKNVTYRSELEKPTIGTDLSEGEEILKVFPGGRRITKFSASVGKWCLTNQRLIYEGSKLGPFSSKPDTLSFSLENFTGSEIISAGRLDKYLEVRFATKTSDETAHIIGRRLEEIKEALQKYETPKST